YEIARELLSQSHRPDAIFTSNSLLTAGAFQAIRDSHLKVPNDVALVGFDETTWGELVDPPITLIAQPTEEIGRTATELLFQRIAEPTRSTKTASAMLFPGTDIELESSVEISWLHGIASVLLFLALGLPSILILSLPQFR